MLKLGRGDGGGRRLCYQITPMPGREARWSSQSTRPKQAKKDRVSFCLYNYVPWETSAEFKPKQTNRTGDWTLLCRYVNSSSWMGVGVKGGRGGVVTSALLLRLFGRRKFRLVLLLDSFVFSKMISSH